MSAGFFVTIIEQITASDQLNIIILKGLNSNSPGCNPGVQDYALKRILKRFNRIKKIFFLY
jgi:hypothetical protein